MTRPDQTRSRAAGLACAALLGATTARAYTAAGDRVFPATILLPQIAPTDELYVTGVTQPVQDGRNSSATVNFSKTIFENAAIGFSEGYNWAQLTGHTPQSGWQNTALLMQYTPIVDGDDELIVSIGGEHEFGGTGSFTGGANPVGGTMPTLYVGKGMGNLDAPALRPFAVAGIFGYNLADNHTRADLWVGGVAIEYSLPYLVSKVAVGDLPDSLRGLTPMTEFLVTTPAQPRPGVQTSAMLAPGLDYAAPGWELGAEALIPVSRGAGQGLGFTLQLHLALDYLLPETLGKPLFE